MPTIQNIVKKITHLLTEYFKTEVIVQDSGRTYAFTDFKINSSKNLLVGFLVSHGTCMWMYNYQNHKDVL